MARRCRGATNPATPVMAKFLMALLGSWSWRETRRRPHVPAAASPADDALHLKPQPRTRHLHLGVRHVRRIRGMEALEDARVRQPLIERRPLSDRDAMVRGQIVCGREPSIRRAKDEV